MNFLTLTKSATRISHGPKIPHIPNSFVANLEEFSQVLFSLLLQFCLKGWDIFFI